MLVRYQARQAWTVTAKDDVRYLLPDPSSLRQPTWHRVTTTAGAAGLPVRSSARSNGCILGHLFPGERVLVHSRARDWARVDWSGSAEAWVQAQRGSAVFLTVDQGDMAAWLFLILFISV